MAKEYRAAIIGCGRIAGSIDDEVREMPGMLFPYSHAGTYEACDRTTLVAAADVVDDKLAEFCTRWEIPQAYGDYRELIAREQPDIISVTTRPAAHRDIVVFAAEHGVKAIWCEKPLCCSMAEADEMVAAQAKTGKLLAINWPLRWFGNYVEAKRIVDEGVIGTVTNVHHYGGNRGPLYHGADKEEKDPQAGDLRVLSYLRSCARGELNPHVLSDTRT